MLSVKLYIEGNQVDLFNDEKITLNQTIQNISDISKTFADFSQSFSLPASNGNNRIFQHYYNSDVDGTFNPNIRKLAKIELGSFDFKFGVVQLEDVKVKDGQPYSYSIRFYSATVNLSDRFGDDELTALDLSAFDHAYNVSTVMGATKGETLFSGDVYYPLISSVRNYEIGTANTNDITTTGGAIVYTDLKPALRLNRILDAIETKYSVTFTRPFFNRAVFDNLFMWLHRDSGKVNSTGDAVTVDLTTKGNLEDITGVSVDLTANSVSVVNGSYQVRIKIDPETGFDLVPYNIQLLVDGVVTAEATNVTNTFTLPYGVFTNATPKVFTFKVSALESFDFKSIIFVTYVSSPIVVKSASQPSVQSVTAELKIENALPKLKVKEFITSLIRMFNLVLVPINQTTFEFIPLDEWYARGNLIDLTPYVDIKDVTVKRPKLFKKLQFKHQQSGQILNERFRNNNGLNLGYGDLATTYDIDGTELNIETNFDNLMFERLQNRSNGDLTDVQVGKSIDKNVQPYIGKPYIFYRCGYSFYDVSLKVNNYSDLTYTFHTGTENDTLPQQITNSVNFSSDVSTYTYGEITRNLFNNFWIDYISDLYDSKRRNMIYKAYLPTGVLIKMKLNDRLQIGDKVYIQNTTTPDLTTGETTLDLLNWIGDSFTSINDRIALTADTTLFTADTTTLTADMTERYIAQYSPIVNGVSLTDIIATTAHQKFDLKVSANAPYNVIKVDTGDGVGWVTLTDDAKGNVIVEFSEYTSAITTPSFRDMQLTVSIGVDTFTINLTQGR